MGGGMHAPTVIPQREFPEKKHNLPDTSEEIKSELRLLAQEAIIVVTRDSSNPLRSVDDWLDHLRVEGDFTGSSMEQLLLASIEHLRRVRVYELSIKHDDTADRCGSLLNRFEALHARIQQGAVRLPAAESKAARAGKSKPRKDLTVQKLKREVNDLRKAGLSHREICDRLGSQACPPHAAWRDDPWPLAYRKHTAAVTKWISKAVSDLP